MKTSITVAGGLLFLAMMPVGVSGQSTAAKPLGVTRDPDTGILQKIIVASDGASLFEDLADVSRFDISSRSTLQISATHERW